MRNEAEKHPIVDLVERHLEADRRYLEMVKELHCMLVPVPDVDTGNMKLVWADVTEDSR